VLSGIAASRRFIDIVRLRLFVPRVVLELFLNRNIPRCYRGYEATACLTRTSTQEKLGEEKTPSDEKLREKASSLNPPNSGTRYDFAFRMSSTI